MIRYDNRDVGLSSKLDGQRAGGSQYAAMLRSFIGRPSPAVYTVEHLADDGAALLDHLGIERAHVVGASMGGMIPRFSPPGTPTAPPRSASSSPATTALLPPPAPKALFSVIRALNRFTARRRRRQLGPVLRIIGSPAYPAAEDRLRRDAEEAYDRSYYPVGVARHFGAVLGSGSLRHYDRRITAPTVVIHGKADRLMRPSGGRAIARNIPGARLVLFPEWATNCPNPCGSRSSRSWRPTSRPV